MSPRLPELDDVNAKEITRLFGNTPGAFVVRDRPRVFAPLVVESPSVLISGGLREWVLYLLGQREATVGVRQSPVEFAGGCERQGSEARRGGLLALVPEPGHLLHASLDHSAGLGGIGSPVRPGHEIDGWRGQALVTQPVGDLQASPRILDRLGRIAEHVPEPPQPVESLSQPGFVLNLLGKNAGVFDIPLIPLDVLSR